jgi:N-acetylmuramoyl-L-alanine amidase
MHCVPEKHRRKPMKKLLIVDAGHGGTFGGIYFSVGKRSPSVPPGIYEGEFNRSVARYIERIAGTEEEVLLICPGPVNIPLYTARQTRKAQLGTRIGIVNEICNSGQFDPVLVSIHANASGTGGWSSASGSVVFISRNPSPKDIHLAACVERHLRGDDRPVSRGVKRSNFAMVRYPKCPSVLVECGFMTSKDDCSMLSSESFRMDTAQRIYHAVKDYFSNGF